MFLEVADCGDGLLDWNWNWNWWVWGLEGLTFGADGGYFGVKVLVHGGCGVCWGVHGGGGLFVYGGESRDDKIGFGLSGLSELCSSDLYRSPAPRILHQLR